MVKIPATAEGVPAIRDVIADGRNVNVTLIFGLERYVEVMDAYLDRARDARRAGADISKVRSVGSFFVSRVDTEVDRRLEQIGTPEALALRGKAAVAQAKLAYRVVPARRSAGRAGRRSPPRAPSRAASAVGVDVDEEPGVSRHALRRHARSGPTR